jgi:hypothetical protein
MISASDTDGQKILPNYFNNRLKAFSIVHSVTSFFVIPNGSLQNFFQSISRFILLGRQTSGYAAGFVLTPTAESEQGCLQ